MILDDHSLSASPLPLFDVGPTATPGTRVLIVSGDARLPGLVSRALAQAGCSVTAVVDAAEALALLRIGYRPGLLVLDERVPLPDRAVLFGSIETAVRRGDVTVVAASGTLRS